MKIGFIGVGHMASAILDSIFSKQVFLPLDIFLYDLCAANLTRFQQLGASICKNETDLVFNADFIILAVKPTQIEAVLNQVRGISSGKCFLSIAAGVSVADIERRLHPDAYVIRVMPNITLRYGYGATAIASNPRVPENFFDVAHRIFEASGVVSVLDESQMNAVISVNGSSPAYFLQMIEAMVQYAVSNGFCAEEAKKLAAMAMKGTAEMLLAEEDPIDEMIRRIATPGGTTEAALRAMTESHFSEAVAAGMDACTKRAEAIRR